MPKSKNQLKYAIGEIFIVVIGIFIAFELQNFKENLNLQKEQVSLIKSFINDMKRDSTVYQNAIAFDSSRASNLKSFVNMLMEEKKDYDSIISMFGTNINNYQASLANSRTYDLYKNSGKSSLIENDSIASMILGYYETIQPIYKSWRKFDEEMGSNIDRGGISKEYRKLDIQASALKMNNEEIPMPLFKKYIDVYAKEDIYMQYQINRQNNIEVMTAAMDSIYSHSIQVKQNLEYYLKEIK